MSGHLRNQGLQIGGLNLLLCRDNKLRWPDTMKERRRSPLVCRETRPRGPKVLFRRLQVWCVGREPVYGPPGAGGVGKWHRSDLDPEYLPSSPPEPEVRGRCPSLTLVKDRTEEGLVCPKETRVGEPCVPPFPFADEQAISVKGCGCQPVSRCRDGDGHGCPGCPYGSRRWGVCRTRVRVGTGLRTRRGSSQARTPPDSFTTVHPRRRRRLPRGTKGLDKNRLSPSPF